MKISGVELAMGFGVSYVFIRNQVFFSIHSLPSAELALSASFTQRFSVAPGSHLITFDFRKRANPLKILTDFDWLGLGHVTL